MINKIKTLVWLRVKQLTKNKSMMMLIFMPLGLGLMYKKFLSTGGTDVLSILSMVLNMSFIVVMGNTVSNVISEEKEKNNMRTLIMSGVSGTEYIVSTLIIPVTLGLVTIIGMPMILDADISSFGLQYYIVSIVNAIATTALYLLLALISKNQSSAQVYNNFAMFIIMLIPMLAPVNETVQKIYEYTFMNSLSEMFVEQAAYSFTSQSFIVALVWMVGLLVATFFVYNAGKKKGSTSNKIKLPILGLKVKA